MISVISVAAAAGAVAVTAGFQTMAPQSQWYGRTFARAKNAGRQLALTYDDGPNDPDTLHLLDVLARYDVRASFFLLGSHVDQRPRITRDIVDAGHCVGNHTYDHRLLTLQSARRIREQIIRCQQSIEQAASFTPGLFRPPFGGRRPAVLRIARELGLQPVMWSVTGHDWDAKSVERIEQTVSRRIRGGDVILLHDGGHLGLGTDRSRTVAATERLIRRYRALGYQFVTVAQMMDAE